MKSHVFTFSLTILVSSAVTSTSLAKDVKLSSPRERLEYIKDADVWEKPAWLKDDFSFDPAFDITKLDVNSEVDELLQQDYVTCEMTDKLSKEESGGKTEKFFCQLMKINLQTQKYELVKTKKDKPVKIKVKYGHKNYEIQGEVFATRLLRALGFYADRMFPVKTVQCFGCTAHPFKQRHLDSVTLLQPRLFHYVAIEQNYDAEEIKIKKSDLKNPAFKNAKALKGWNNKELLGRNSYSSATEIARKQIVERDALMVIGSLIRHTDNKRSNNRLACKGKISDKGKCIGQPILMFQDVGFVLGSNIKSLNAQKFNLNIWRKKSVWEYETEENKKSCRLNTSLDHGINTPHSVTEEGRQLAAQLLTKFVEGEAGRKRVEDLFKITMIEEINRGKVASWTDAFIFKSLEVANRRLTPADSTTTSLSQFYNKNLLKELLNQPDTSCKKTVSLVLSRLKKIKDLSSQSPTMVEDL